MPFFFKVCSGLFIVCTIMIFVRRIQFAKYDDIRKGKALKFAKPLMKIYKVFFCLTPLYILIGIFIMYRFHMREAIYMAVALAMGYIVALEDYFFIKRARRRPAEALQVRDPVHTSLEP